MDVGKVSAATLTLTPNWLLTVKKQGTGGGIVGGPGIACGSDCSSVLVDGTAVTLAASPDPGSTLAGWAGCATVKGNECTLTMGADQVVIPTFTSTAAPTVARQPDGIAPNTALGKHPKAKSHKHKVKFTFSSTESGSTFRCKLDKGAFKACTSPFKKTVSTGKHSFEVEAVDTSGNVDATPAKFKFKVKP